MNYNLEMKLSQKMTLTKELKQSLDILQMTFQDIIFLINEEMKENPLLELEDKNELDWEKYLQHMKNTSMKISNNFYEDNEDENNIENYIPHTISLIEHLEEEITLLQLDKLEFKIANYLISFVNEDGYLKIDLNECAKQFNIETDFLEKLIKKIQAIEPVGICARSIEECLIIQLEEKKIFDETLYRLINDDLEKLAKHNYKDIIKKYGLTEECLKKYIYIIKALEPKPGRIYNHAAPIYIFPDIVVRKENDELVVRLNKDANVRMHINKTYKDMFSSDIDADTRQYLKGKMTSASNLLKAVEQRKNTILKVGSSIVNEQKNFFIHGKSYLVPLTMKDIARITGFHESTISRTVNGKYMLTPNGLFEFKFFFSNKISDKSGESLSNKSVKDMLKTLIQNENKQKPYSDSDLCQIFAREDIEISRRTVTKYRESLKIPSSSKRKEL